MLRKHLDDGNNDDEAGDKGIDYSVSRHDNNSADVDVLTNQDYSISDAEHGGSNDFSSRLVHSKKEIEDGTQDKNLRKDNHNFEQTKIKEEFIDDGYENTHVKEEPFDEEYERIEDILRMQNNVENSCAYGYDRFENQTARVPMMDRIENATQMQNRGENRCDVETHANGRCFGGMNSHVNKNSGNMMVLTEKSVRQRSVEVNKEYSPQRLTNSQLRSRFDTFQQAMRGEITLKLPVKSPVEYPVRQSVKQSVDKRCTRKTRCMNKLGNQNADTIEEAGKRKYGGNAMFSVTEGVPVDRVSTSENSSKLAEQKTETEPPAEFMEREQAHKIIELILRSIKAEF